MLHNTCIMVEAILIFFLRCVQYVHCPTYVKKKQKPFMDQDEEVGKLLCSSKKMFKLKTTCIKMCIESVYS